MKKEDKVLKSFIGQIKGRFGFNLNKIILFGSRARNDAGAESDYDILFIFNKVTDEINDFIEDTASKILFEKGVLFSAFVLSKEQFGHMRFEPFIINAQKEGVAL